MIEFLQARERPLADPAALGLPEGLVQRGGSAADSLEEFFQALAMGDEAAVRRVLLGLHLARRRVSELGDELIAPVFARIGSDWMCGSLEVYQERRACVLCRRLLDELFALLPQPPASGPTALGCTPAGDQYNLASQLVALVLRQRGWNVQLLGENVPLGSVVEAVRKVRPQLIWLSVSHVPDPRLFVADYRAFAEQVRGFAPVVVGGNALKDELAVTISPDERCESLTALEHFLDGLPADPAYAARAEQPDSHGA